jgi:DNA-binding response OmpR family regulator
MSWTPGFSRLRAKIDKSFDQPVLYTVRGTGYKLDERP